MLDHAVNCLFYELAMNYAVLTNPSIAYYEHEIIPKVTLCDIVAMRRRLVYGVDSQAYLVNGTMS